uniref:Uncharacterized protein n=1 Tax=Rhizophora mucronata TaxID=61149 RepID=A0A2P2QAK3_RHIMU
MGLSHLHFWFEGCYGNCICSICFPF